MHSSDGGSEAHHCRGGAVRAEKRGVAGAGASASGRLHGPRFSPEGLGLNGLGPQAPKTNDVQCSADMLAVALAKAAGWPYLARGIEARKG
jgi:hypothetical protein